MELQQTIRPPPTHCRLSLLPIHCHHSGHQSATISVTKRHSLFWRNHCATVNKRDRLNKHKFVPTEQSVTAEQSVTLRPPVWAVAIICRYDSHTCAIIAQQFIYSHREWRFSAECPAIISSQHPHQSRQSARTELLRATISLLTLLANCLLSSPRPHTSRV